MALRGRARASRETSAIPTRFSEDEVARMDRARARVGLPSRSAFVRQAVTEKLDAVETMRVIEVRDVSEGEAVRLIDRYLAKRPGVHYVDDIADALGIELRIAFAAAQKLLDRGRARVKEG